MAFFNQKENVIGGRLILAGTGMPIDREIDLEKDEPPTQPTLEDLLQRGAKKVLSFADFGDEQLTPPAPPRSA